MSAITDATAPVYSSIGGDPDLGELVTMFVDEMPDRIAALEGAFARGDMDALRRAAHQLKGAAGSYGFDEVTHLAASVEASVKLDASEQAILESLQNLVGLCRRLRSGQPG